MMTASFLDELGDTLVSMLDEDQKIGCHLDNRFSKTNYLKTNLLKQIKNIIFQCKDSKFDSLNQIFEPQNVTKLIYIKRKSGKHAKSYLICQAKITKCARKIRFFEKINTVEKNCSSAKYYLS